MRVRSLLTIVKQRHIQATSFIKLPENARRGSFPKVLLIANTLSSLSRSLIARRAAPAATSGLSPRHPNLLPKRSTLLATTIKGIVLLKSIVIICYVTMAMTTFLRFFLVAHEAAHEVETEAEDGENGPENSDHLPSVWVCLRQESGVDGLRVLAVSEEVF